MRGADVGKVIGSVVALCGAAAMVVVFNPFKSPIDLPHRVVLVDVETGRLYQVDTSRRGVLPPLRSPETGRLGLVPVSQVEGTGRWKVGERYASLFDAVEAETMFTSDIMEPFEPANARPEVIEAKY